MSRPSCSRRRARSTRTTSCPCSSCVPRTRRGSSISRRVFGDGRTRAYAWGRAAAREDVAAATERLVAMSGQFEQRRLARPAYQLDVLDAFCGDDQLAAASPAACSVARATGGSAPARRSRQRRGVGERAARRVARSRRGLGRRIRRAGGRAACRARAAAPRDRLGRSGRRGRGGARAGRRAGRCGAVRAGGRRAGGSGGHLGGARRGSA